MMPLELRLWLRYWRHLMAFTSQTPRTRFHLQLEEGPRQSIGVDHVPASAYIWRLQGLNLSISLSSCA